MTNFRFWGGWFLVFAGLSILLTMGCEKGALGVKSATVTGKIVDKDNTNTPIPNAIVRMMSKEAVGSGELPQGSNFLATNTDANGNFVFENVSADNVVLEVNANGYAKIIYPSTQAATTDDGQTEEVAQIQSIYVRSGSVTNVGYLSMSKISNPLPETINTSIVLRDATTLELIDEKAGPVTISFNNQTVTLPVSNWRDGIDLTGNPITLTAETKFTVMARANSAYYLAYETEMSGTGDIQAEILLTPVSYNLLLRCTNVPDYIEGGVVNVYAENIPTNVASPPKVIATHTISSLGNLTEPNLPAVVSVPGLALPVNLRIQVRGYEDEVMQITSANLPAGSQGTYRVDVNFLANNGTKSLIYDPILASQAGLLDNRVKRDVVLEVAGQHLLHGDSVSAMINLPYETLSYHNTETASSICSNNKPVRVTFGNTVVGYNLSWGVTISPTIVGSPSYASGSFSISSPDPIMINVPNDVPAKGILIGADAKRSE